MSWLDDGRERLGMSSFFRDSGRFFREVKITRALVGFSSTAKWLTAAVWNAPTILKTKSLATADRSLGSELDVRCGGRILSLSNADFGVCREILGHDCYRISDLRGEIRTAIDLGCNFGTFTLMAATLNPGCRILAVDVNPEFTIAALGNAAANGFGESVTAWACIVGSAEVESVRALQAREPMASFDPAAAIALLGGCDFLKCDVEGGEHLLFSGDLRWLRDVRRLAIEYHWTEVDGERLAGVLTAEGFEVERRPHRHLGYLFAVRRP